MSTVILLKSLLFKTFYSLIIKNGGCLLKLSTRIYEIKLCAVHRI